MQLIYEILSCAWGHWLVKNVLHQYCWSFCFWKFLCTISAVSDLCYVCHFPTAKIREFWLLLGVENQAEYNKVKSRQNCHGGIEVLLTLSQITAIPNWSFKILKQHINCEWKLLDNVFFLFLLSYLKHTKRQSCILPQKTRNWGQIKVVLLILMIIFPYFILL